MSRTVRVVELLLVPLLRSQPSAVASKSPVDRRVVPKVFSQIILLISVGLVNSEFGESGLVNQDWRITIDQSKTCQIKDVVSSSPVVAPFAKRVQWWLVLYGRLFSVRTGVG